MNLRKEVFHRVFLVASYIIGTFSIIFYISGYTDRALYYMLTAIFFSTSRVWELEDYHK